MAYLVRKIRLALWPDGENIKFESKESLPADTITGEFKTANNELSCWRIEDLSEIEELSASVVSKFDLKAKCLDLIALPFEDMEKIFLLKKTPDHAFTAIPKFKEKHYDICGLNYGSVGDLATLIAQNTALKDNNCIFRIKVNRSISLIKDMIKKGEVEKEQLGRYIKKEMNLEDEIDLEINYHQKIIEELKQRYA